MTDLHEDLYDEWSIRCKNMHVSVNELVRECPELIDVRGRYRRTIAFYWRIHYDFIDMMIGERLNIRDNQDYTPLDYTIIYHYPTLNQNVLIEKFATVNARLSTENIHSVLNMLINNKKWMIPTIIKCGLIDTNTEFHDLPLWFVVMYNSAQDGLALLNYGANPHAFYRNVGIIDFLIHRSNWTYVKQQILSEFGVMVNLPQLRRIADDDYVMETIDALYSFD
jgi:hypothetical protein